MTHESTDVQTVTFLFIYGAPAAGKLTVGRELARRTGYKLHHYHMAVDLGLALFSYDDPHLLGLCQRINLSTFERAEAAGLPGLIFTFTYGGALDDPFIDEVIRRYADNVYFIHLICELSELKRRVANEDRKRYRKATDPNVLARAVEAIDYAKDINHDYHLTIDTTRQTPQSACDRIAEAFGNLRFSVG
jgi:hypothetical protein